ncbi:MAG: PAS domain S-box protein [Nitrospiraceae bacterium]|nr:MAG: PAS domain S-box protein [Nitrospiraceae bacterium]
MKKRVLVFLIICFTGLCALLFIVFYNNAEKTAIRQLNDEQKIHAKQAAHGIEDFFSTWAGILNSFSKIDALIDSDAEGKRYMELFYESHHEQIRSITRVNQEGRILHTVPHTSATGSDISGQRHIREILRDHKPVVSNVFWTVQGFEAVALHVPVFRGAEFKGTVAIVIDFEKLARSYLEVIRIGRTGYAWMVSRDGTMLYSPVPGFTGKSVFETCRDFPSIISMTREMLKGREGSATYTFNRIREQTVEPVKKYAFYMPVRIPGSYWSVVVASSEDEVLSSLASFRNRLFIVIGMILFGGVLFSIIGAKAWIIVSEEEKRKKAEAGLRASEKLYRTLFEQSPIGLALCRMDGSLVDVNPAYAGIIGRSVRETLELSYWDLTPEKFKEQELTQLKSLEQTGRYGPYEKEYLHSDGSSVPVRLQGLLIEKGGEKFIWSSVEDISDRTKAEKALQRNEQLLRLFVEHAPAAIAMLDNDMKYIVASRRFIMDYELGDQDIIGRSHYEVFPEIPERWREIHRDCLAGAVEKSDQDPFLRKDGRTDWVRWEIRPWYITQGEIGGIILFSEVITERMRAELELTKHREHLEDMVKERTMNLEEKKHELERSQTAMQYLLEDVNAAKRELEAANVKLKELDQLKSMFIASMSHELRTPLNSIIGFTGMTLQGLSGEMNEEQRDNLQRVYKAAKHLLSLISDVIDISKIEAGRLDVYIEEFPLEGLVKEAAAVVRPQLEEKGLSLEINVAKGIIMHTDRKRLLQCLLNFLSNAVKFTEHGSVKIDAKCNLQLNRNFVEISVSDTGIGVAEEDMPRLFQAFERLQSQLRVKAGGTGLGLYLTKKLATELLHGTVSVKSDPGKGSVFSVVIPREI